MLSQKGFITPIVLLIIAVVALGAVNYFVFVKPAAAPAVGDNLQLLTESNNSYRVINENFAVDKDHVYIIGGMGKGPSILKGADPKTFVKIDLLSAKDANHTYSLDPKGYLKIDGQSTHTVDPSDIAVDNSTPVPGMSKYTDSDFGFSFWYPSGWTISTNPGEADAGQYPGAVVTNTLTIKGDSYLYLIEEVSSSQGVPSITDIPSNYFARESYECMLENCGAVTYFFRHPSWMMETEQGTTPADVSHNSMGGLHLLAGASNYDTIIPLSARKFLVLHGRYDNPLVLANTVLATDPAVATPVGTATQIQTIQFEQAVFETHSNASIGNSLSANVLSGKVPLQVTFIAEPSAGDETLIFGDGKTSDSPEYGCDPNAEGCSINTIVTHTYTKPGTYKVFLYRHMPSVLIGAVTITVQ